MKLPTPQCPKIIHHPQVLWVGIGCKKGTSKQLIQAAIQQVLRENKLAEGAIAGIATIDIKANEAGLIELCRERNLPLKTFSADILRTVCVPNPNIVVAQEVGTPSVAEAAALCAILAHARARQRVGEAVRSCSLPPGGTAERVPRLEATAAQRQGRQSAGETALKEGFPKLGTANPKGFRRSELPRKEEEAKPTLIVPKQIFRADGEGAVTVAVAEALTTQLL